jgi:hypothetical protein
MIPDSIKPRLREYFEHKRQAILSRPQVPRRLAIINAALEALDKANSWDVLPVAGALICEATDIASSSSERTAALELKAALDEEIDRNDPNAEDLADQQIL